MSCGVPGHRESAERKGDREWCEVHQHQVNTKGTKMGHAGLELSRSMLGQQQGGEGGCGAVGQGEGEPGGVHGPCLHNGALIRKLRVSLA